LIYYIHFKNDYNIYILTIKKIKKFLWKKIKITFLFMYISKIFDILIYKKKTIYHKNIYINKQMFNYK